jgi:hypothetical protein
MRWGALLLIFGCIPCPVDDAPWGDGDESADGLAPVRDEWRTVLDHPFDVDGVDRLTVGGVETAYNFANRGDVEVYYADTGGRIVVQMRRFSWVAGAWPPESETGETSEDARTDFELLSLWAYAVDAVTEPANLTDTCDAGPTFASDCQLRVYWPGQIQKLRAGADLRVFVPAQWRGHLHVATEDNLQELDDYPDRSDVRIIDLAGSAFIELDAGRVSVRLATDIDPVPACTAEENASCLADGWEPTSACAIACADFGRLQVRTRGAQAIEAVIDTPETLWSTVRLTNTHPDAAECQVRIGGVTPANGDCGEFGPCDCLDCDPATTTTTRVELARPASSSPAGLGYSVDLESGACEEVAFVEGPQDFQNPRVEARGDLTVCAGCLAATEIPSVPRPTAP